MRALLVATLVFVAALAGCSGKKGGDDELHYTCPDGTVIHGDDFKSVLEGLNTTAQQNDFLKTKCPKSSGSGSKTNTTTLAPNVLPTLKLKITDAGGNATNVTMLKGNLTFDATGSSDPDGQISAIAITVKDLNQTRTRQLYNADTKKFTPQKFVFDRAGPVNVSVRMVDDRAGFVINETMVYVDQTVELASTAALNGPSDGVQDTDLGDPCSGATPQFGASHTIVDSQYFWSASFTVAAAAEYVEVVPAASSVVTICDPDLKPVSATYSTENPTLSTNTAPLPPPVGATSYSIGFYVSAPNKNPGATVTVHYEPRPAAAA